MRKQLVVNVFPVRREQRLVVHEPTYYGKTSLQHRQPTGDDRYRHGDHCGRLLATRQPQRAQHESNEQTAGIPEEHRCGMEVVSEKPQDAARQHGASHGREEIAS